MRSPAALREVSSAWDRFWFQPTPTSTLAVVRIAYGALVLAWCGFMSFDLMAFFSSSGMLEERVARPFTWTVLEWFPSDVALVTCFVLLAVAAACVLVGWHTRLATVVVAVLLLSFERRNLVVLNSADSLLRLIGIFLMFAPAGAALSVDRWRRARDRFWEFPERAPWALRLVQLQISALYLFTVWLKVQGETWNEGTAVSYSLRITEVARFEVPISISTSALVSNLLTYGTLAVELSLALLIWNRRARPWVIAAGVALHLSIQATILVGLFSVTVFVGYLAFTPPETMSRWLLALRDRLRHSAWPPLQRLAAAGPPADHQPELPWPDPSPSAAPTPAAHSAP